MCSFKSLTFKFDFDIIKIEHRFLSSIVCLFNYNFGASYVLFQYLLLIIPHFRDERKTPTFSVSVTVVILISDTKCGIERDDFFIVLKAEVFGREFNGISGLVGVHIDL